MKKVKYIALVMVLVFGLLGVGYAAWTSQVEIQGTVATADMDVEWIVFLVREDWTADPDSSFNCPRPPHVTATANIDAGDAKIAHVAISNLYPENPTNGVCEKVALEGHIKNMGTIPVLYDKAIVTVSDYAKAGWIYVDYRTGKLPNGSQPWQEIGSQQNGLSLNTLAASLDAQLAGVKLEPGDVLTFGDETIYFYLPQNAPDWMKAQNITFNIELQFKQFNQ